VFQFAIFYNSLLEFTWCAPLIVNGRTHANGNLYTGSTCQLTFNSLVTKTGTLTSPAWDGHATNDYNVTAKYNAGYSTNTQALTLPIGSTNAYAIIQMPPAGEDTNSALYQARYFNKADLILLVSNSTVTLTLKSSPSDALASNITATYYPTNSNPTNYVQITNAFPFLNISNFFGTGGLTTNGFYDQRENDLVKVTDIDMGILKTWLVTNTTANSKFNPTAGVYDLSKVPNIMYAADNRSYSANQLTAIRLRNATIIPTNLVNIAGTTQPTGFTVATPNPLYVQGNYNCPYGYLNSTNTTVAGSEPFPASLVADALTILSSNWNDANANKTLGSSGGGIRTAAFDTVNAAIMAGIVPSTGSGGTQFSGGAMNLPRLLEDWGNGTSQTLTLNTSIVNMYASTRATNQFENPGAYYFAPIRQFSFDQNFLKFNRQPPGTPMIGVVLRSKWAAPPPNTVTYAGN